MTPMTVDWKTDSFLYGDHPDPENRRVCVVCGKRPIHRYVVEEGGFCPDHMKEAWAAQARHPLVLSWVDHMLSIDHLNMWNEIYFSDNGG